MLKYVEVCNYFEDAKGHTYMGEGMMIADFLVTFERECDSEETYTLYIQPRYNEYGQIYRLDGYDSQDDYELLPRGLDDDELIDMMNGELAAYEQRLAEIDEQ